jgi:signal transduction histidine kinase
MKHSGAKSCRVQLTYEPDALVVRVDDSGAPHGTSHMGARLGLIGVRERAALLGGSVEAGPREAGGWRLQVAFPS